MALDVAWGHDFGDEVAHITTNVSPGPDPNDEPGFPYTIDFFFADQIHKVVDQDSGTVLFEHDVGSAYQSNATPGRRGSVEYIGREAGSGRGLYVVDATDPGRVPSAFNTSSSHFVCFLAWNAEAASVATVQSVARRILEAGCAYICCWGARCSFVHDVFDEEAIARGVDAPFVMSTWHDGEPLLDALRFALFTAQPDEVLAERCRAVVAISIGSREVASEVRAALGDPKGTFLR
jgi:hypothetical protein